MFAAVIIVIVIALAGFLFYKKYSLDFKRKKSLKKLKPFQSNWDKVLRESFILYENFTESDKESFLDKVAIFLSEKSKNEKDFQCDQSLLCAAHACLPILKRNSNFYPLLTQDYKELEPMDWFTIHEKQFEFELGKMSLREFKGEFASKSFNFFYSPKTLETDSKELFALLKVYYGLDPKVWHF